MQKALSTYKQYIVMVQAGIEKSPQEPASLPPKETGLPLKNAPHAPLF